MSNSCIFDHFFQITIFLSKCTLREKKKVGCVVINIGLWAMKYNYWIYYNGKIY